MTAEAVVLCHLFKSVESIVKPSSQRELPTVIVTPLVYRAYLLPELDLVL